MTPVKSIIAIAAIAMGTLFACTPSDKCPAPAAENADAASTVVENIMTRTSVRRFDGRQISKDTLEQIVRCGMAAPTAMNRQPWAFVVVTEREILDSLNAVHPWANLATATAAIIVCGDYEKKLDGLGGEYWVQDCSAASENILLAAHAFGLGAVWCGVYPNPERIPGVKRVLGLPGQIMPLNIIALGYPDGPVEPKDKWNPDAVHYQTW